MVQKKTKRNYGVILCVAVAIIGAGVFLVNCRGKSGLSLLSTDVPITKCVVFIVRNEDSTQIVLDAAQTDKLIDTLSDSALRFRSNYEVIGPYDNYLFHLFFYSSTSLNSSFMIDDKGYVYADGTKYALNRSQEIISYLLSIE